MFDISPIQLLIVLLIALLVFGPKRLPEMGRSLGRGIRELRSSLSGDEPARPRRPPPPPPAQAEGHPGESEDDVLEGVVVPGDRPPSPPREG